MKHDKLSEDTPKNQKIDLIQQTDLSGHQILQKSSFSWLSRLCNCFRAVDSGYSTQNDQVLLAPQKIEDLGRNTLVLDLDETLVHSSFTKGKADILLDIVVDGQNYKIYVLKRPGVDEFLRKCAEVFEVVVFTASLPAYADPLLDKLDPDGLISYRLFRDSCSFDNSGYVKDLSRLGRELKHVVIIDNSPTSYSLQPDNAVPIKTWLDDPSDKELENIWEGLLEISMVSEIPKVLRGIKNKEEFSGNNVKDSVRAQGISRNRGPFNSPVHMNGGKFKFDM